MKISRPRFCYHITLISETTRVRESLREQGKLKLVIASIQQQDTDLYALHNLQQDQGILTDAPISTTLSPTTL